MHKLFLIVLSVFFISNNCVEQSVIIQNDAPMDAAVQISENNVHVVPANSCECLRINPDYEDILIWTKSSLCKVKINVKNSNSSRLLIVGTKNKFGLRVRAITEDYI